MRNALAGVLLAAGGILLTACATQPAGGTADDPATTPPIGSGGALVGAALLLAPAAAGRTEAVYDWEPEPPHPSPQGYVFDASPEAQWLRTQTRPLELRIANGEGADQAFLEFDVPCGGTGWGPSGSWTVAIDTSVTSTSTDANGTTTIEHPAASLTPGALVSPALGCTDASPGRAAVESFVVSSLHASVSGDTLQLSDGTANLWFRLVGQAG